MIVFVDTTSLVIGLGSGCISRCKHAIAMIGRCFWGLTAVADCACQ